MAPQGIISPSNPLPPPYTILRQIARCGALDEISNHPGAVRHHIYHFGRHGRKKIAPQSLLFFVYQTGRYGPQNGFRLCIVHQDFRLGSDVKGDGEAEDEIDRIEREIPQGHMEVVVLGEGSDIEDPVEDE